MPTIKLFIIYENNFYPMEFTDDLLLRDALMRFISKNNLRINVFFDNIVAVDHHGNILNYNDFTKALKELNLRNNDSLTVMKEDEMKCCRRMA